MVYAWPFWPMWTYYRKFPVSTSHSWNATASSPGVAWADLAQIQADVSAAKREADLVIVMLHGGLEITTVINNITDEQRLEARTAIDSGTSW